MVRSKTVRTRRLWDDQRVKKICGKKKTIEIFKLVNPLFMGGEILAIMWLSGAGKTSLLECATLNQPPNAK